MLEAMLKHRLIPIADWWNSTVSLSPDINHLLLSEEKQRTSLHLEASNLHMLAFQQHFMTVAPKATDMISRAPIVDLILEDR